MLADILEEHLDEAVWLFERRRAALANPAVTDQEPTEVEERLRAHLDGFVLGGAASWDLCRGFLAARTAGQAFVAAIAALEGGEAARREDLEAALANASSETYDGVRWACRLTTWPDVLGFLLRQLDRPEPTAKAVAIDALTGRRLDPGPPLGQALLALEPPLAIAALVGAGRLGLSHCVRDVEARIRDKNPDVAAAALESLVVLDPERGRPLCRELVQSAGPTATAAANLLAVVGTREDVPLLAEATRSKDAKLAREAILALGELGDPGAVPTLIDALEAPKLAGVASLALRRILGPECPQETVAFAQSGDEDVVDWTPDDELPRLSAEAVRRWWKENRMRVRSGIGTT